jgi:hypothetical protein
MTAGMGMSPLTAVAAADGCPVTDPPVINRCGPDAEPTPPPAPPGVRVAMCQDGAVAFTQYPSYRGTCAENGGVSQLLPEN